MPRRPKTETPWEFLPSDDESEDPDQAGPEQAAMHIETVDPDPLHDAGRQDVDLGPAGDRGDAGQNASYFDDEMGESGESDGLDDELEPDVEDLLITQHYLPGEDADGS